MRRCGSTGVERTPSEKQHTKLTLKKKMLPPLLPGFELTTFRSRVRRSTNKLSHLLNKLKIGQSEMYPCDTAQMTTYQLLQHCPLHDDLRSAAWPEITSLREKFYDDLTEMKRTAALNELNEATPSLPDDRLVHLLSPTAILLSSNDFANDRTKAPS